MILHNEIQQNSEEWLALRVGKFTASTCADLLMKDSTAGYTKLIDRLIEERFTSEACESDKFAGNAFTDRGHTFEPIAIMDYELKYFYDVDPIGFVEADDHLSGCSPDGFINDNGLIQIKCPIFATQRKYHDKIKENAGLSDNDLVYKLSSSYFKQMQFELMRTEREYNIFYSFHPRLKEISLKVVRDEKMISLIENKMSVANLIIEDQIKKLTEL